MVKALTEIGEITHSMDVKSVTKSKVTMVSYYLKRAQEVAYTIGVRNLFYNEQYVELIVAELLGHTYNTLTRGADAHDGGGNPVEYKAINLSTTPRGSFQFHWLSKNKLDSYGSMKDIYFILRYDSAIEEIWKLPMSTIFSDLVEKYEKAETDRIMLNTISNDNKNKNINAHKSYSLNKVKELGAILVYQGGTKSSVGI